MNKSQKLSVDEDEELIATANSGVHVIFVVQKWFYAPPPLPLWENGCFRQRKPLFCWCGFWKGEIETRSQTRVFIAQRNKHGASWHARLTAVRSLSIGKTVSFWIGRIHPHGFLEDTWVFMCYVHNLMYEVIR